MLDVKIRYTFALSRAEGKRDGEDDEHGDLKGGEKARPSPTDTVYQARFFRVIGRANFTSRAKFRAPRLIPLHGRNLHFCAVPDLCTLYFTLLFCAERITPFLRV